MFVSQYTYDLTEHIDMDLLHFLFNHKEHGHLFKKDTSIEQIRNYRDFKNIQLHYNGPESKYSRTFFDYDEDIIDDLACLKLVNKLGEFVSVEKKDILSLSFSLEHMLMNEDYSIEELKSSYFTSDIMIGWEDGFIKHYEEVEYIDLDTILNSSLDQLLSLIEFNSLPITKIDQARCHIDLCYLEYIRMKRGVKNV